MSYDLVVIAYAADGFPGDRVRYRAVQQRHYRGTDGCRHAAVEATRLGEAKYYAVVLHRRQCCPVVDDSGQEG